jgi:DNA replication ATP-dependent helicase Dna2
MFLGQDLLDNLRQFILSESDNQRSALLKKWSLPLSQRVNSGWAIEGLRVAHLREGLARLTCAANESRFREGDLLLLHRGSPNDAEALQVELTLDEETEVEVEIQKGNEIFLKLEPEGWILDQNILDLSNIYLQALDEVADSLLGRSTILPLLSGGLEPKINYPRYERGKRYFMECGMDESQAEAAAMAYATDLVHLIQGPPGTGKTRLLAQLAAKMADDGLRIMVTALTHRAIHNALNKIADLDMDVPVCKIGSEKQAGDLRVENFENFMESAYGDRPGGYIIGATPFCRMSQRLANVEFDVVIFDEASQVTLPLAIMGMLGAGKYIFVGDDQQLPPVSSSEGFLIGKESIFSYLAGRGYESMLKTTYRLNDVIVRWPSITFYQGKLVPTPLAAARRLSLAPGGGPWDFALDPDSPAIFLDLCTLNTTVRSRREAETVCELILALLERGIPPYEIGVVVPYRAQSRVIRSLLRRLLPDPDTLRQLVVDTVERMQGQEREVVIVSFTTSSPAFAAWVAEFFFQPQRLNVAVTRPRTKLILVGSRRLLSTHTFDPEIEKTIKLMGNLMDACRVYTIPEGSPV